MAAACGPALSNIYTIRPPGLPFLHGELVKAALQSFILGWNSSCHFLAGDQGCYLLSEPHFSPPKTGVIFPSFLCSPMSATRDNESDSHVCVLRQVVQGTMGWWGSRRGIYFSSLDMDSLYVILMKMNNSCVHFIKCLPHKSVDLCNSPDCQLEDISEFLVNQKVSFCCQESQLPLL